MASKRSLVEKVERLETRVANLCGQLEVAKRERDKAMGHRDEALNALKAEIGKTFDLNKTVAVQTEGIEAERAGRIKAQEEGYQSRSRVIVLEMERNKLKKSLEASEANGDDARNERDNLRRQLATIREKHTPFYEALYPGLRKPSILIPPQTFNYHAVTRC